MKVLSFKYSLLAASIVASTTASAALYQVVEVGDVSALGNESYGSAIKPHDPAFPLGEKGCFESTATCDTSANPTDLAGDTRTGTDGLPLREEAPFGYDNRFHILDFDDLERYCYRELGYNSCENWAHREWQGLNGLGGLSRERNAFYNGYSSNAKAFKGTSRVVSLPTSAYVPGSGVQVPDSNNAVINKQTTNGDVIGSTSSGYYNFGNGYGLAYRERGFFNETILQPLQDGGIVQKMGRTMAFDSFEYDHNNTGLKTYVVGSGSVGAFDYNDGDKDYNGDLSNCSSNSDPASLSGCQNFGFTQKAFVWDVTDTASVTENLVSDWNHSEGSNYNEAASLASARGVAISKATNYTDKPVLAGFNSFRVDSNLVMQATVFYPNATFDTDGVVSNAWTSTVISGATIEIGDDYIYSNSKSTDINENLLVIGGSKLRGDRPESGAAANKMFTADARDGSPSANYFSGGIFFNGAGGDARAINKYNEIVGQVDAENAREYEGKIRRHRGFIYPYSFEGTDTTRRAIFQNKAWWLDDLTNDGSASSSNNQFRILDAADINDAGVIAATALKCDGGYDDTSHNSYCTSGNATETIVAVKLVPIAGANSANIQTRGVQQPAPERQGGGIGLVLIGLFGLLGFRLKK